MFYYLYQITNLVNNKIYVGVHKTKNLDDGYMGSGKVIKDAIRKYGIDNFRKDILETFENVEAMYAREKEIVTDEFLLREDVYNLRRGGTGGFDYINKNSLNGFSDISVAKLGRQITNSILEQKYGINWKTILSIKANNALQNKRKSDPEFNKRFLESAKRNIKIASKYSNTKEAIEKKKKTFSQNKHQQGENNSQYGTMWINNGAINKKIKKNEPIPEGWVKGRKI